eukprot:scaffold1085_cov407-Prasinococcus_capsulatus_cf.AAC.15
MHWDGVVAFRKLDPKLSDHALLRRSHRPQVTQTARGSRLQAVPRWADQATEALGSVEGPSLDRGSRLVPLVGPRKRAVRPVWLRLLRLTGPIRGSDTDGAEDSGPTKSSTVTPWRSRAELTPAAVSIISAPALVAVGACPVIQCHQGYPRGLTSHG